MRNHEEDETNAREFVALVLIFFAALVVCYWHAIVGLETSVIFAFAYMYVSGYA